MADWTVSLPSEATAGDTGHVDDHNAIVAALTELRAAVDALTTLVEGKADAEHTHAAGDTTTGTFSTARIPALGISKVTNLQAGLDSLETRIQALEA